MFLRQRARPSSSSARVISPSFIKSSSSSTGRGAPIELAAVSCPDLLIPDMVPLAPPRAPGRDSSLDDRRPRPLLSLAPPSAALAGPCSGLSFDSASPTSLARNPNRQPSPPGSTANPGASLLSNSSEQPQVPSSLNNPRSMSTVSTACASGRDAITPSRVLPYWCCFGCSSLVLFLFLDHVVLVILLYYCVCSDDSLGGVSWWSELVEMI